MRLLKVVFVWICLTSIPVQVFATNERVRVGAWVPESNRVALKEVDHSKWTRLLARYVNAQGAVDYRAWKTSDSDLQELDVYLRQLSTAKFSERDRREQQLAYWINAYNAVTIKGILRVYPTTNIRRHAPDRTGFNIWKHLVLVVDGKEFSLDDIEHKQLRTLREPRIHFAIVCASKGCPPLLNEAYESHRLDRQLSVSAQKFFSQPQNFSFDAKRNTVYLSQIFQWFSKDFGNNSSEVLRWMEPYLPVEVRKAIRQGQPGIGYLPYDWTLNGK